jgi:hypothetical protein
MFPLSPQCQYASPSAGRLQSPAQVPRKVVADKLFRSFGQNVVGSAFAELDLRRQHLPPASPVSDPVPLDDGGQELAEILRRGS